VEVAWGSRDPFREEGHYGRVEGIVITDRHHDRERRVYGR
jgi:hypothetical protein